MRGKEKRMSEYIVRETGYPGTIKQEIVGELVRCRDCRYFDIVNQPYDQTWCVVMRDSVKPDGYCYRGERREE